MRRFAGVVRNNKDLKKASIQLEMLYFEVEALYQKHKLNTSLSELRNMVNVAHLIIQQSLIRKENRGGYFNEDYNKESVENIVNDKI
jgi:L-aspartate oxidase